MLFKHFYTWIKYKTLPPSFLFKNRLFVERDSKKTRILNNVGLTFRNEKWTNWESSHLDWKWVESALLWSQYVLSFVFIFFMWKFYSAHFFSTPAFNSVAFKFWVGYDFVNYYTLYAVWILILMRSFIWDTFIVVLLSGSAKQYYPLARREEARRQLHKKMRLVVPHITTSLTVLETNPKLLIWMLMDRGLLPAPRFSQVFESTSPLSPTFIKLTQTSYRISFFLSKLEQISMRSGADFVFPVRSNPSLSLLSQIYLPTVKISTKNFLKSLHYASISKNAEVVTNFTQKTSITNLLNLQTLTAISAIDDNYLAVAKAARFKSSFAVNSPTAFWSSIRVGYLKTFIANSDVYNVFNKRNLWMKGVPAASLQTTVQSFNLYKSKSDSRSKDFENLAFIENSINWLIKRSALFSEDRYAAVCAHRREYQRISSYYALASATANLGLSNLTTSHNKNLRAPQTNNLVDFSFIETSGWLFWTEDVTKDLVSIYLSKLNLASANNNLSPRVSNKIRFNK